MKVARLSSSEDFTISKCSCFEMSLAYNRKWQHTYPCMVVIDLQAMVVATMMDQNVTVGEVTSHRDIVGPSLVSESEEAGQSAGLTAVVDRRVAVAEVQEETAEAVALKTHHCEQRHKQLIDNNNNILT